MHVWLFITTLSYMFHAQPYNSGLLILTWGSCVPDDELPIVSNTTKYLLVFRVPRNILHKTAAVIRHCKLTL